ncbi:uncharacterized protein LOC125837697 [Solanum verrucosum]|uniref:uncharacterized protein LOC125837697 n=1 Tax=Solanum verrucosum TaxID=315347 RepID=UPI0020D18460|nr:uncharacterized protein LOC125837697 [Solanum verrucosum]
MEPHTHQIKRITSPNPMVLHVFHLFRSSSGGGEAFEIMPPRRVVRGRPARRNVDPPDQGVPNAAKVQPQGDVTNAKFWDRGVTVIRMFSQVVANQAGSSVTEDPKNFVEELQKVFEVMHVVYVKRVDLAAYQLKGVVRVWYEQWKKSRVEGAPIMSWVVFKEAFTGRFFPRELREVKIVADKRSRMSLFVSRLSRLSSKEGKTTILIEDIDIAKMMIHVQKVEEDKLRDREEIWNKKAKTAFNENKPGECRDGSTGCFKCGQASYFMIKCPKNKQVNVNGGNRAQSSSTAPPDRVAPGGATSGTGRGANRLYAITSRQEKENFPDVVTSMIKVFTFDVYALLDPGASLSFVTPYVAIRLDILTEQLLEPFSVSTRVGESILVERVYRDCTISVNHKYTMNSSSKVPVS